MDLVSGEVWEDAKAVVKAEVCSTEDRYAGADGMQQQRPFAGEKKESSAIDGQER